MTRTLFEISEDLRALAEILEEAGGEIPDSQAEEAIDQFFAELGTERDRKLDSYCAVIREFESKAEARKTEANRLLALANSDESNAKRLKKKLHNFLEARGERKIETNRFKIALQKNGGKTPVILDNYYLVNAVELPEAFRKVTFSPDLDAIRIALETDEETEAIKFAVLGERGEHLRIR